jgi:tetratricopeptide (TPR) repeat protein
MSERAPIDVITEQELEALAYLAAGQRDSAVALLRDAAAKEDALPVDFGPPTLLKPTHELLAETLLEVGRAKEAQAEFRRALVVTPKRSRVLLGLMRASTAAGDNVAAAAASKELRDVWHRADPAELALVSDGRTN